MKGETSGIGGAGDGDFECAVLVGGFGFVDVLIGGDVEGSLESAVEAFFGEIAGGEV